MPMANRKFKSEQVLLKRLEDLIRNIVFKVERGVKGFPTLKQVILELGYSDRVLTGCEALAFEELLGDFCPAGISSSGHSRAVVDKWIRECVIGVLEKEPTNTDLNNQI